MIRIRLWMGGLRSLSFRLCYLLILVSVSQGFVLVDLLLAQHLVI